METIDEIYKKYAKLIKNYIFSMTGNETLAEDVMQETFIVAIKEISRFRGDCEISVWLRSIAKKILYKECKKNNAKNTVPMDALNLKDSKDIEKEYIQQNNIVAIYKSLQKLDATTREVMYLRITGNFTFKEIASILNKSENWARVTFFRGKQKLEWENIE